MKTVFLMTIGSLVLTKRWLSIPMTMGMRVTMMMTIMMTTMTMTTMTMRTLARTRRIQLQPRQSGLLPRTPVASEVITSPTTTGFLGLSPLPLQLQNRPQPKPKDLWRIPVISEATTFPTTTGFRGLSMFLHLPLKRRVSKLRRRPRPRDVAEAKARDAVRDVASAMVRDAVRDVASAMVRDAVRDVAGGATASPAADRIDSIGSDYIPDDYWFPWAQSVPASAEQKPEGQAKVEEKAAAGMTVMGATRGTDDIGSDYIPDDYWFLWAQSVPTAAEKKPDFQAKAEEKSPAGMTVMEAAHGTDDIESDYIPNDYGFPWAQSIPTSAAKKTSPEAKDTNGIGSDYIPDDYWFSWAESFPASGDIESGDYIPNDYWFPWAASLPKKAAKKTAASFEDAGDVGSDYIPDDYWFPWLESVPSKSTEGSSSQVDFKRKDAYPDHAPDRVAGKEGATGDIKGRVTARIDTPPRSESKDAKVTSGSGTPAKSEGRHLMWMVPAPDRSNLDLVAAGVVGNAAPADTTNATAPGSEAGSVAPGGAVMANTTEGNNTGNTTEGGVSEDNELYEPVFVPEPLTPPVPAPVPAPVPVPVPAPVPAPVPTPVNAPTDDEEETEEYIPPGGAGGIPVPVPVPTPTPQPKPYVPPNGAGYQRQEEEKEQKKKEQEEYDHIWAQPDGNKGPVGEPDDVGDYLPDDYDPDRRL
eukprot:TRINITY_DN251_c0_g1_i1.p1 TRINITY_DN251_c0_g1~~TRINITY_DN251_c0_g1_i1.p1  ORF type:complete len:696 (+),score=81.82 TRINITY_DN251_c0_g1_i1:529-2616(+)